MAECSPRSASGADADGQTAGFDDRDGQTEVGVGAD